MNKVSPSYNTTSTLIVLQWTGLKNAKLMKRGPINNCRNRNYSGPSFCFEKAEESSKTKRKHFNWLTSDPAVALVSSHLISSRVWGWFIRSSMAPSSSSDDDVVVLELTDPCALDDQLSQDEISISTSDIHSWNLDLILCSRIVKVHANRSRCFNFPYFLIIFSWFNFLESDSSYWIYCRLG